LLDIWVKMGNLQLCEVFAPEPDCELCLMGQRVSVKLNKIDNEPVDTQKSSDSLIRWVEFLSY